MRLLIAAVVLLSVMSTTAQATPLGQFQWQYRPFLIFGATAHDDAFREQFTETIEKIDSLYSRDMLRINILSDTGQVVLHAQTTPKLIADQLPTAKALQQRYNVGAGQFAAILVGKDGGEKGRWLEPVSMDEVFALIDRMPMRQREMRQREITDE